MNLYTSLTIRYLKENKRRTIVTIIGIILSTALICGIGNIFESFMNYQIRETIKNDGAFHAIFYDVNKKNVDYITKSADIDSSAISRQVGYTKITDKTNNVLSIKQYDKKAFDGYKISLKEGKFPSNDNEIVLSESILNLVDYKYKIGETITLKVGDLIDSHNQKTDSMVPHEGDYIVNTKNKVYKIVGIINKPGFESSDQITTGITYFNPLISDYDLVNVSVIAKNPREIYKITKKISNNVSSSVDKKWYSDVKYNEHLLRLQGASKYKHISKTITSIIILVTILVVICTVATVYNSFSISIAERKKQFGVLNSIGATSSQIKKLVLIEGGIISLIAIPIGVISATVAINLLFKFINTYYTKAFISEMNLQVTYNPIIIMISVIVVLFTIFISILLPAISASNISPLDIIKGSTDYKVGKVKNSKLIKLIFKTEGVLVYKNLGRNRKKFTITLFSLIISVVIFIAFSGFMVNLLKGEKLRKSQMNYDLYLSSRSELSDMDKVAELLKDIPGIKKFEVDAGQSVTIKVKEDRINKNKEDLIKRYYQQKKFGDSYEYDFYSILSFPGDTVIEDKSDKLVKGSFDKEKAIKENGVIFVRKSYFESEGKKGEVELTNYNVGDTIECEYTDQDETLKKIKIKILGVTDESSLVPYPDMGLKFITYDEVAKNINLKIPKNRIYIDSDGSSQVKKKIDTLSIRNNINFYDESLNAEAFKHNLDVVKVFVYGFISVISLVSITNILNTISTSINLRKRELAIIQSIGVTPQGFRKMIYLESFIYGILSLLIGVPVGVVLILIMNRLIGGVIEFTVVIPWLAILICIVGIFIITFIAAYIPMKKLEKENIIENIRKESI